MALADWNPWRGLGSLPSSVKAICAAGLINRAGTMVLPYIAVWLVETQGFTASEAGLAAGCYGLGGFAAAPLGGRFTDRFGAVLVMRCGLAAAGALLLLLPFAASRAAIYALIFTWALFGEVFRPANLAALATLTPPEDRKPALSLGRLAVNLGMSIGPAAGGFLIAVSYWLLFLVDAITSMLAALWLHLAVKVDTPRHRHHTHEESRSTHKAAPFDRRAIFFLAAFAPVGLAFVQHHTVLLLFLVRELHQPKAIYGVLLTINTLLIVVAEVRLNFAMRSWPASKSLPLGALMIGGCYLVLAFHPSMALVIAAWVVWTFGEMIVLPASAAYMAEIAPAGETGRYMGRYQMIMSGLFAAGPWIGTATLDRFGSFVLWTGAFTICAIAAILLSRLASIRHAAGGLAPELVAPSTSVDSPP